jgi:selenocysteine-specific elongation factor
VDRKRARQLLDYLEEHGRIAAQARMYFGAEVVARARRQLAGHFEREQTLTVSQFGQLIGTTRKYSVPFLQLLEQQGMLRRVGDKRVLCEDWQEPN